MKKLARGLVRNWSLIAILAGAALVTAGAGMIFLPAGFLTGGGMAIAGGILSVWGEDEGGPR